MNKDYAILAGGCFWCTEAIFENVDGVISVYPGYIGGKMKIPHTKKFVLEIRDMLKQSKLSLNWLKFLTKKFWIYFLKHMIQQHSTDKGMILAHNTEVLYFTVMKKNLKLLLGKLMNCKMITLVKS